METAEVGEHEVRAYRSNIWKFYIYNFLLTFQLFWPIWVVFLTEKRGLPLAAVASFEGFGGLVIVLAQVPTGAFADKYGRRISVVIGNCLVATAIFLFALAKGYYLLLPTYMVWHIGLTFRQGADGAMLFDTMRALGRQAEYQKTIGRMMALSSAGTLIAMLFGARVADRFGMEAPIFAGAASMALSALVASTLTEPPFRESGTPRVGFLTVVRESAKTLGRLPAVRHAVLLASIVGIFATWAPGVWVQPFLRSHGVAVRDLGNFMAPSVIIGIIGGLIAYRVAQRLGVRTMFVLLPGAVVAGYLGLAMWDAIWAYALILVIRFSGALLGPTTSAYLNHRIPSAQRATILSAAAMLPAGLIVFAGPGLGRIADEAGLLAMFWTIGLVLLAGGMVALSLWLRADRKAEEQAVLLEEAAAAS